ncbi:MAG: dipeptidase PepE [Rikenellaceae bacterium]|nr:dipeptidase PepE [Rikenellaceae bacterium]
MDNQKRLLLISNSTTAGEPYLKYPIGNIEAFLKGVKEVAFVPYAAVTFSYDAYEAKVQERFDEIGIKVRSIHRDADPAETIRNAEAICVGGGNTFALLKKMHEQGVVEAIREKVEAGTPYVGWSAGSNVCCPTICTTNDMPIVQPASFAAVSAVKFQINPHYLDTHPEGHAGETREQRIQEYIEANEGMWVAGLREGCMLLVENGTMQLIGARPMRMFRRGTETFEVNPGDDLSFLL